MDSPRPLLAELPAWGFGLVLVICRIGAACMLLPGIGEAELPGTVRAGFVLALTALLLPVLAPLLPPVPAAAWVAVAHGGGRDRSPGCGSAGWPGCWCRRCRWPGSSSPA